MNNIIRCSTHTLKFTNIQKLDDLAKTLQEYRKVCQELVDFIWAGINPTSSDLKTPKFIDKTHTEKLDTWLSARMVQCIGKQALGMVLAATKKQQKRYFILKKLQKQGKNTSKLQSKIDRTQLVKPNCSNINMELDSRFVSFQEGNHFDLFIQIASIGNKIKIRLPIKKTKVSNKWLKKGKLKRSIRLNTNTLVLLYEVVTQRPTTDGGVLAIDQGLTTVATSSDGQVTTNCPHGHDLKSIIQKISRSKKGSKGFQRATKHRTNYINWSINQLNLEGVTELRIEKLYDIGRGKSTPRFLQHWTYTEINNKIKNNCEEKGICIKEVPNKYRSQRCSYCGYVHKLNRNSERFCCRNCLYIDNADFNASKNLLLDLPEIPTCVFENKINHKSGFFWNMDKVCYQESIVLDILKNKNI